MASITIEETPPRRAAPRALATGFTALRIFFGLDWLSNGLAKLFDTGNYDWGFFSFNLITRGAARSIATDAASKTQIAPLGAFYRDVVLPHWGFFGTLQNVAELAIGIGLLLGIATRLAAHRPRHRRGGVGASGGEHGQGHRELPHRTQLTV